MSWIKNTGSPPTGHPFSSLNPEAVAFVPRQDNASPAEESPVPVVPSTFSKRESTVEGTCTQSEYVDKTVVAVTSFSENSHSHQPYIAEQPVIPNLHEECHSDKPEPYCIEENSSSNDMEDCQTKEEIPTEESPNGDEVIHSSEHLPSPVQEEPPRHSYDPDPHSDQNFRNRNSFRSRGNSGYSDRRGRRGNFRGRNPRGRYNDNQYRRSGSGWPDDNNPHQSSDMAQMNEESSNEQHACEGRESSFRPRWDPQDRRERRSRDDQSYRDNERENRRRPFPNDKPKRENNNSPEGDWNNSRDSKDTVDNRGRRGGRYAGSRGGGQWRGSKFDKPRYGGRQNRRNANSSEDELRSHNESSWDNYHVTDGSNFGWDLDEKQNNERQPLPTKSEDVEHSNSWSDEVERNQSSSVTNTLEKQDKNSLANCNNDTKENFESSPHPHSKAEDTFSNEQHENWERRQGSSRTRGVERGLKRYEQNWREKRNRDDESCRNYNRQNRQRTFSNDKHERQNDGRVARRGMYSDLGGSNQQRGNYHRSSFDSSRYGGPQDGFSSGNNSHKGIGSPEDDLKITHDESSFDNYHITDDDSNNALDLNEKQYSVQQAAPIKAANFVDMKQKVQPDLKKPETADNSRSWNDEIERNQSSSIMNTSDTLFSGDTKEPLHKPSKSNNKSDRSSQRPHQPFSKSRSSFDEIDRTDLPEGTNLMDQLMSQELTRRSEMSPASQSENNTETLNEKGKLKSGNLRKHSEKPTRSLDINNGEPSSIGFKKSFAEEKNENVAERVKETRQITETRTYTDPRMEREKLNKSCGSVVLKEESDRKKDRPSDKQRRKTSYLEPNDDRELLDKEFNLWEKGWGSIKDFKRVVEVTGDLFEQPKDYSLAHCVAEDLRMGSGIAVAFKREFKSLPDLLDQKAKQGGLATLHDTVNNRYVYYLVTKRVSTGKPTYFTLWKSLCKMRDHVKQNEVKKIAVPRLACGLDRLEWDRVKSMLETLFKDVDVEIRVCNFQQNHGKTKEKLQTNASQHNGKSKKKRNKK